jgi:hypothetical protein
MSTDVILQKIADAQQALGDIHEEWIKNSTTGEDYDDGFDAGLETAKDIARRADPLTESELAELRAMARDAERYRAFMSSARFKMMGVAGFIFHSDGTISINKESDYGWHHLGLEIWDRHPAGDDAQGKHGRALLTCYIDHMVETRAKQETADVAG